MKDPVDVDVTLTSCQRFVLNDTVRPLDSNPITAIPLPNMAPSHGGASLKSLKHYLGNKKNYFENVSNVNTVLRMSGRFLLRQEKGLKSG